MIYIIAIILVMMMICAIIIIPDKLPLVRKKVKK